MEKRPLRIGIDIDDVLVQSAARSIELYNLSFGSRLTLDDWYNFSDPDFYGPRWGTSDIPEIVKRVVATLKDDDFLTVETVDGAQAALLYLNEQGHKLFAITGRSEGVRAQTKALLDKNFSNIFTDETLFFVDHFEHDGKKVSKADIGLQLNLTHFVEDLPAHANTMAYVGIKTVLLNAGGYGWSTIGLDSAVSAYIIQLDSWKHTTEYFDAETARQ